MQASTVRIKASRLCAPDGDHATERDKGTDRFDLRGDSRSECEVCSDTLFFLTCEPRASINKCGRHIKS